MRHHTKRKKTKKKCHIPIKRSWHEQTATMTINNNNNDDVGEQNKNEHRILRVAYQTRK